MNSLPDVLLAVNCWSLTAGRSGRAELCNATHLYFLPLVQRSGAVTEHGEVALAAAAQPGESRPKAGLQPAEAARQVRLQS